MKLMFSKPRSTIPPHKNIFMMNVANNNPFIKKPEQHYYQPQPIQEVNEAPSTKKMKWGEPVWFFFHTLAEKVKPESFLIIRMELLHLISDICKNLPCPTCSQHATDYLASTNFNIIQTKDQLIDFFYTFHNSVNQRKGVALFPRELLREKYSRANISNIINHFLFHFIDKSHSIRMIADDFHRHRLVQELKRWLSNNLHHFQQ